MSRLRQLWRGEVPLEEAFWTFAVLYGLAVNLLSSFAFLALIAGDRPLLALVAGYGPSVPYNVVVLVGVWRAADRAGSSPRADLYRVLTLVGIVLLTIT